MNIFSFSAHFTSEEACRKHFKSQRDHVGVICTECGSSEHYWIKSRGATSVKRVIIVLRCEVGLLCKVPIYPF